MKVIDMPIPAIVVASRQRRNVGDIQSLIASIQSVGLLHPIVVGTDGKLKVGYRRLIAYKQMGRDTIPAHATDNLDDILQALHAERDENVARKDLTPSEIVDRARELDEWERAEAQKRQKELGRSHGDPSGKFPEGSNGRASDKVGEAFGISGKTYDKAKQVVGAAEEQPELFGDLPAKMDDKSVDAAYKELQKREREARRAEMAAQAEALPEDERWRLETCDLRLFTLDERVDFIITDPPYPKKHLPLYGILAERALEWLRPDGLLLAMCGESYLDQIMEMMGEHLDYYWTGCYLTPGSAPKLREKQVNCNWKPILIYQRPGETYKGKPFSDVWASDKNDKDYHDWGQSLSGMASIIQQVCLPGQTIFDPFCGAGTTGIAALSHGCFFIGIDKDEKQIGIAKKRLYDWKPET